MAFTMWVVSCGDKESDSERPTNINQIRSDNGTFYLKDSKTPYTGKIVDDFGNGGKKLEFNIKNGNIFFTVVIFVIN